VADGWKPGFARQLPLAMAEARNAGLSDEQIGEAIQLGLRLGQQAKIEADLSGLASLADDVTPVGTDRTFSSTEPIVPVGILQAAVEAARALRSDAADQTSSRQYFHAIEQVRHAAKTAVMSMGIQQRLPRAYAHEPEDFEIAGQAEDYLVSVGIVEGTAFHDTDPEAALGHLNALLCDLGHYVYTRERDRDRVQVSAEAEETRQIPERNTGEGFRARARREAVHVRTREAEI